MRRVIFVLVCYVLSWGGVYAHQDEKHLKIMAFMGTASIEELDSDEVERLSVLLDRPLRLNTAGLSDLEASGLFSAFQTAALLDYRSRHGSIMSFTELAAIDGFGTVRVEHLKPFVSLDTAEQLCLGTKGKGSVENDLVLKGAVRQTEIESGEYQTLWNYAAKYKINIREACQISLSISRPYDESHACPSLLSGNVSCNYRRGKVVVGDFNACFGQGLSLWNTAIFGSLTSPTAFMKKPSGISPSFSFTGENAMTGVSADYNAGRWRMAALLALEGVKQGRMSVDDVLPAVNLSRFGRRGQVSVAQVFDVSDVRTSCDAAFCFNGVNVYGETVMRWNAKAIDVVMGTDCDVAGCLRLAGLIRYLPSSNVHGAAVSGDYLSKWASGVFSVDGEYYPVSKSKDGSTCMQVKFQSAFDFLLSDLLSLKCRLSERMRTWGKLWKTELRIDLCYGNGPWLCDFRFDFLKCDSPAILGYMEIGYKHPLWYMYLRQGAFMVDDWDDRIYVYERDAPGTFNVPAYYGRGVWTAVTSSLKASRVLKLYLRASYVSYPFMLQENKKPGRAELKIQCVFRF